MEALYSATGGALNATQAGEGPLTREHSSGGLLWDHPDHVEAKQFLVAEYLFAWASGLRSSADRAVFVDGFAGQDEYESGLQGSPFVALDVVRQNKGLFRSRGLDFVFIEEDWTNAERIQRRLELSELPNNTTAHVHAGSFEEAMGRVLERLAGLPTSPTFVVVDPFGGSGVPFDVISRLAKEPNCSLLVVCTPETIERWGETKEAVGGHVDRIFRGPEWRGLSREDQMALYENNLKAAGFSHTSRLRLTRDRTAAVYYLVHAAHDAGIAEAMDGVLGGEAKGFGAEFYGRA